LQQRVQGSCQLWVPLADHDILTVTCPTTKLLPFDKAATVTAALSQSVQVYHGHQVGLYTCNGLKHIP